MSNPSKPTKIPSDAIERLFKGLSGDIPEELKFMMDQSHPLTQIINTFSVLQDTKMRGGLISASVCTKPGAKEFETIGYNFRMMVYEDNLQDLFTALESLIKSSEDEHTIFVARSMYTALYPAYKFAYSYSYRIIYVLNNGEIVKGKVTDGNMDFDSSGYKDRTIESAMHKFFAGNMESIQVTRETGSKDPDYVGFPKQVELVLRKSEAVNLGQYEPDKTMLSGSDKPLTPLEVYDFKEREAFLESIRLKYQAKRAERKNRSKAPTQKKDN